MIVLKFGGTSVGTFDAVSRTMGIIADRIGEKPLVCVSALSKVTDLLYEIAATAAQGNSSVALDSLLYKLRTRHLDLVQSLLSADPDGCAKASARVNEICDTLSAVTGTVTALGDVPDRIKAVIISFGEILSSTIICYALNSRGIRTGFADARTMIFTDSEYLCGAPQFDRINAAVPTVVAEAFERGTAFSTDGKAADGKPNRAVITQGFISSSTQGAATVLGRGGSDYSASILASALGAERVEIWTDVDGIRTTDPRVCPTTARIPRISYDEASRMALFGAKVLHPMTIAPAVEKNIPIWVLNSMSPKDPGTEIVPSPRSGKGPLGIAFKRNVYLFRLPKASRESISGCLEEAHLRPDIFAVSGQQLLMTVDFAQNVGGLLALAAPSTPILLRTGYSQMSIIGEGMTEVAAALEEAVPSVRKNFGKMIEPGNITYIVASARLDETVRDVHRYLFE